MQRVAVIGCGGSGKTTIGRRVAAVIGTEVVHLDALYYDSAWNPSTPLRAQAFMLAPGQLADGPVLLTVAGNAPTGRRSGATWSP
jgi:adenylate kinase family enzyme